MIPGLPRFSPPFRIRVLLSTETEEQKKRGRPGHGNEAIPNMLQYLGWLECCHGSRQCCSHANSMSFRRGHTVKRKLLNPLTTEFFPPRQHIFMHSAHTTFVGTPLPQHTLLSGQTWWGPHTWRDPSGNTVNDIHDPPQGQQSEVKCGCQPDFRPAFP